MGIYDVRPCPCGSGENSWWMNDCHGIPLCRVCDHCEDKKRSKYKPSTFTGYGCNNYTDAGEMIEPNY